jgi:hypothetical protein
MTEKNKRTVMIFTIIASLIPAVALMKFPTSLTVASVSLWASAVLGYMGIVLLLWM